jgi:hypothetical protein
MARSLGTALGVAVTALVYGAGRSFPAAVLVLAALALIGAVAAGMHPARRAAGSSPAAAGS